MVMIAGIFKFINTQSYYLISYTYPMAVSWGSSFIKPKENGSCQGFDKRAIQLKSIR